MRVVLKSKIHRAWVTDANPDYVGSILIDEDLMDIMSFDVTNEPVDPQMILVDQDNRFVEFLEGAKHVQQVH